MAEKKLVNLKTQRAVLIDQQERVKEFVEKEAKLASLAALELRLCHVEKQMNKFLELQSQIEALDDNELKEGTRATYEEIYFSQQPALATLMQELKQQGLPAESEPTKNQTNVRLPKISLPSFAGDVTQWTNYFETFKVLIHDEPSLSKLQKYQYLKSSLSGIAAAQIASLELNPANYDVALKLLKTKYDDKKVICQKHLEHLLNMKPLLNNKPEHIRSFVDNTNVQLRALEALGRPVKQWDDVLVYLILQILDPPLRSAWEDKAPDSRLPSLEEVLSFLNKRSEKIEATRKAQSDRSGVTPFKSMKTSLVVSKFETCILCKKGGHTIYKCRALLNMTPNDRCKKIRALNLCYNCLQPHSEVDCKSIHTCQICKSKHHTLLHNDSYKLRNNADIESTESSSSRSTNKISLHSLQQDVINQSYVFMPTAIVNVADHQGKFITCRAILDSASQLNFISERLVQQLGLKKRNTTTMVNGIGQNSTLISNYSTSFKISSRVNNFSSEMEAVILSNITGLHPLSTMKINSWNIPGNIQLSDPEFHKANRIDLLIGAELHFQLLQIGQISLGENLPILQKTILGWVVAGKTSIDHSLPYSCNLVSAITQENDSLSTILQRFWELEDHMTRMPSKSMEDNNCETHFKENYQRDASGRFIVRLPFRQDTSCLGDSLQMATRRFLNLERRLHKDSLLFNQYKEFVMEYLKLEHMRPLQDIEISNMKYLMPHHCVIKPDSSSTRLRVVFDASAKTTTDYSLNEIMMTGPVIQQDLFTIILRFRKHSIAVTADICKMYRQILVNPEDCVFQNIMWRDHPSQKIQFYQLRTVTYGTAAAPFLSTRSLLQLSIDEQGNHPLGSDIIKSDFYVDDLITGANTLIEAKEIKRQVEKVLQTGGFQLRKWCSNNNELLKEIPAEHREKSIQFHETDALKILGLIWQPQQDSFKFKINLCNKSQKLTKRTILADIARLFDPMGLINPVVVLGKIFMQQLWKLNLNWDESLPLEFQTSWSKYKDQLWLLQSFQVPRRLYPFNQLINVQLHAFSDASERAYGTCLYLRCTDNFGTINVSLICAKSRVAPIRQTSIPRLELCAALLMVQLVARVKTALNIAADIFYWTDSKIVLAWIVEPSTNWCTFVANRVSSIQELSNIYLWRHVDGSNNPADLVSRGALPEDFLNSSIWLNGPSFLHEQKESWKDDYKEISCGTSNLPERRKARLAFIISKELQEDIVKSSKYLNSFTKLQNVFSYILRFIKNSKLPASLRKFGVFGPDERDAALKRIIQIVQRFSFAEEYNSLTKHARIEGNSRLRTLTPFLDEDGLIRVGGRLENSILTYDAKHPMLLPSSHPFTKTLMTYLHCKNMHAGPQTLLAITRQRFWPLTGGSLAKQIVHSCIRCFRTKPRDIHQIMGNLPAERVQPNRPFFNSGVDFCGPFFAHFKIRGRQPVKTYIAIFVCFSTKAVHLELASDLSSAAFLVALRRFIGRRGFCANLFCDNATNFTGANSELKALRNMFASQETREEIIELCSKDNIAFHFIPPRSPHFGGLWEAAVKSAKYHLRRVIQGHSLTFEELNTFVIQTEAILNSRPLQPLSTDPNDLSALTPGHFLIGEPLTAIVEPNLKERPLNRLDRWQQIQWAQQQFWSRWAKSYLNQLQCRNKWNLISPNVIKNSLVLLKEENTPSMKWVLGRVVDTHPGDDGKVRVVSVKTASGLFKRSITKLCQLPMNTDNS